MKDTVAKEHENDEVGGVDHAAAVDAALRLDARVHHLVPVLAREDLSVRGTRELCRCEGHTRAHRSVCVDSIDVRRTRPAFFIPDCNQYLACGSTHNLQCSY